MSNLIVFTDLDGTLLDAITYSFGKAIPALRLLDDWGIPLICCSSKTRPEIEHYRALMRNHHPFVTENGGGIFIPHGYFPAVSKPAEIPLEHDVYYEVMTLGTCYAKLRKVLCELRDLGFAVRGFGDMTVEEVAEVTGLGRDESEMAKERHFDEPFLYDGPEDGIDELVSAVEAKGLHVTQGQFFHILGNNDKGKAVAILTEMYEKMLGKVMTVGLGDSPNDLPMLQQVDYPIIVHRKDGRHHPRIDVPRMIRADGIGPEGWNAAMLQLLEKVKNGEGAGR
jgi:mannosyl-3-phosphoglycerate phosphatase family protein